jgi:alkanesulfonate monooxygenase SsuD/methylene tetrahydromethanopterin reductase-like flavin-dependent oxidoreductase (luciferase family)
VSGSPGLPKPFAPDGPPIIIGGHGKRRTPRLAARYAAEFNVGFSPADVVGAQFERVQETCDTAGRDPGTLVHSAALTVCCGRDESEVRRRADAIGRDLGELRESGIVGTPAECVETIGRYASVGTERLYLQVLDLADLDHLDLLASEVRPQL